MLERLSVFVTAWFQHQTDYCVTVLLCGGLLCVVGFVPRRFWPDYRQRGVWLYGAAFLLSLGLTVLQSQLHVPHGLAAHYDANPTWKTDNADLTRYFEADTPGQWVERFLDFQSNDFNDQYAFSGQPFSVVWQGLVYAPADGYHLRVHSNFGVWLAVDDNLVQGAHQLDVGTAAARAALREGWAADEWWGTERQINFAWLVGAQAEFYLGLLEPSNQELVLRCQPLAYPHRPPQMLSVAINGEPIGAPLELQDGWQTYRVPVPQAVLQKFTPGFFRVRLTASQTARPVDVLPPSQDGRSLAVAVDFVLIQRRDALTADLAASQSLSAPVLRKGWQRLTLHAVSNGQNPFLALQWRVPNQQIWRVVPHEALFAAATPGSFNLWHWRLERVALSVAIILKGVLCLGLLGWALQCLRTAWRASPRGTLCLNWESAILLAICCLGLGSRLMVLWQLRQHDPEFTVLPRGSDQLTYVFFARGLWRGYWPGLSHDAFFFNPLYAFYVALCMLFCGDSLFTVRLITLLLATVSIWLTYQIARNVFSARVGLLAAAFCAANGVLITHDTSLLIDPLVTLANLLVLWELLALQARTRKHAIRAGVWLGISTLLRGNSLLLLPFFGLWIILGIRPQQVWPRLRASLLVGICLLLTILPITFWNYRLSDGHFVLLSTNGGKMLWMSNNASADGTYNFSHNLLAETRQRIKTTGSSFTREVFRYIRTNPRAYLHLEWQKFAMFWRGYEVGNLISYYWIRQHYAPLLQWPWLNFVILGPCGLLGMLLGIRQWQRGFWLYAFVALQLLTTLLFMALARYRIPVIPILSIWAAYACSRLAALVRRRAWGRLTLLVGLWLSVYVCSNYPYAAQLYAQQYQRPLPWQNMLRYWDLFSFDAP